MTTSTSRSKWTSRKSTLHRHERPLPKPEKPKPQVLKAKVKVKMEFDMDELLGMQALSEYDMATNEELDKIFASIKNEFEPIPAVRSIASNTQQSPHPKSEVKTPHQPPPEPPPLPSPSPAQAPVPSATPTASDEAQTSSDPVNSSTPTTLMLSENAEEGITMSGSGSGLAECTPEVHSALENNLFEGGNEIGAGVGNEVPGSGSMSSEIQRRSPEQEQHETSVNVSELISAARPLSIVMNDLLQSSPHSTSVLLPLQSLHSLQTHLTRLQKELSLHRRVSAHPGLPLLLEGAESQQETYILKMAELNFKIQNANAVAAELDKKESAMDRLNKECSEALQEIADFRETEQRAAADVERMEKASRKKARELEALDRDMELKDAELSEVKERLREHTKTLVQQREVLEVREAEVEQRERELRELEVGIESREFELRKREKALRSRESISMSIPDHSSRKVQNSPPEPADQIVEIPESSNPAPKPSSPTPKKRKLCHEDAQVTSFIEESSENPRYIIFHITRGQNTKAHFYEYIEGLEIPIERLAPHPKVPVVVVDIHFTSPHAAMAFMTQQAYNSDPGKSYDGYSPVRIDVGDGFITASWGNQFHSIPWDIAAWIVKHGASRVLIVEKLSPDITKAQLRNDFSLQNSLLKTYIENVDGDTIGRLHYRSIGEAVAVKMKLEHGQNTSGKSIRTYLRCTVRFGRGSGCLY
ncbi:hypothetical protein RUND412_005144 [Rhizina undulata]